MLIRNISVYSLSLSKGKEGCGQFGNLPTSDISVRTNYMKISMKIGVVSEAGGEAESD